MANKPNASQKKYALQYLAIARQRWEKSGTKYPDYLSDRDAFYKTVRQEVLPEFAKAGGSEEIFLKAMREYAREDWVRSGYNEKEFDRKFKSAKRRTLFRLLLGVIGGFFVLVFKGLIEKFFEISIGREDMSGYVVLFILSLIAIPVIATAVGWVKSRLRDNNDDEITSLKLN